MPRDVIQDAQRLEQSASSVFEAAHYPTARPNHAQTEPDAASALADECHFVDRFVQVVDVSSASIGGNSSPFAATCEGRR